MVTLLLTPAPSPPAAPSGSHFCPCCLRRVAVEAAERRTEHEDLASGALDVDLLRCPRCGLVLAAEVPLSTLWAQPAA